MAGKEQGNHFDPARLSRLREYVDAVWESLSRPPTTKDVFLAVKEDIGTLQYKGEISYELTDIVFQEPNPILLHPQFEFHSAKREVRKNDGTVTKLTPIESGFFYALISQTGQVVSYDTLRSFINYDYLSVDQPHDIIKVHMNHLRKRIGDHVLNQPAKWRYINNIRSKGYYLNPE